MKRRSRQQSARALQSVLDDFQSGDVKRYRAGLEILLLGGPLGLGDPQWTLLDVLTAPDREIQQIRDELMAFVGDVATMNAINRT
jgi:hypothetical protein